MLPKPAPFEYSLWTAFRVLPEMHLNLVLSATYRAREWRQSFYFNLNLSLMSDYLGTERHIVKTDLICGQSGTSRVRNEDAQTQGDFAQPQS
jgi:hypothetical protein